MNNHDLLIERIQHELSRQLQGRWSQISLTTNAPARNMAASCIAVWKIDFADGDIVYPNVNFVYVGIDKQFPRTQPKLWIPGYVHGKSKSWPHIDNNGTLCLPRSSMNHEPEHRIIQHLAWAQTLLNMDPVTRRKDFMREAAAYWAQSHTNLENVYSLLSLKPESRVIAYAGNRREFFVADTPQELAKYLMHLKSTKQSATIYQGYLVWLNRPWCPHEFPDFANQLLTLIPVGVQDQILVAGRDCLVLIAANSENGVIFFSAFIKSKKLADVRKGFRSGSVLPASVVRSAFFGFRIHKMDVSRVDGAWVHGRDHDPNYKNLYSKRVVVCGCGSLGASIARLLAQAGVGTLHLIDRDKMSSHNASRHLLGVGDTGTNKVSSLRTLLLTDFPHMKEVTAHCKFIEDMSHDELDIIRHADVIVSAGITIAGDLFLDEWRRTNSLHSIHVCAWTEAFAVAGHSVALFDNDTISDIFDENTEVKFRLCDVPLEAGHMVAMAGCGDTFQPHGVIELQPTINISARVVIDALTGKISNSIRRTWFGSRQEAERLKLVPRDTFDNELCIKDFAFE
jgi:hypothetical protein